VLDGGLGKYVYLHRWHDMGLKGVWLEDYGLSGYELLNFLNSLSVATLLFL
jgi:hypothetical protein